mmetsp:Transcript_4661/g.10969  ORF Transcript_4661/g.10969 Transcript_4661/m.10969 type:complete len:172 (-) Transcript_4661:8-523(-)
MKDWLFLVQLGLAFAADVSDSTYHEYVDLSRRPGLRRTVARPDGTFLKLALVDNCTAVQALQLDAEQNPVGELDVSSRELQEELLGTELEVHGLRMWTFPQEAALARWQQPWKLGTRVSAQCPQPEDTHLTMAFSQIFGQLSPLAGTARLLQIGDLGASQSTDPARHLAHV